MCLNIEIFVYTYRWMLASLEKNEAPNIGISVCAWFIPTAKCQAKGCPSNSPLNLSMHWLKKTTGNCVFLPPATMFPFGHVAEAYWLVCKQGIIVWHDYLRMLIIGVSPIIANHKPVLAGFPCCCQSHSTMIFPIIFPASVASPKYFMVSADGNGIIFHTWGADSRHPTLLGIRRPHFETRTWSMGLRKKCGST